MPIHKSKNFETNNVEIAALAAPRPLLLISDGDDWTKNNPTVEFPYLQNIYQLFSAVDKVENVHLPNEKHDYGFSKRLAAYKFLAKHLELSLDKATTADGSIDESKVVLQPEENLRVFTEAFPRPAHAIHGDDAVTAALMKR
jgi:hypothetical protein